MRIKAFTAEPEGLTAYGPLSDEAGGRRFDVEVTGVVRGQGRAERAEGGQDHRHQEDRLHRIAPVGLSPWAGDEIIEIGAV